MTKKRIKGLEFHIKVKDYFGTLATILDLSRQTLGDSMQEREVAGYLERSVKDLMYLQANYRIEKGIVNFGTTQRHRQSSP
jgi:hypothetical protein